MDTLSRGAQPGHPLHGLPQQPAAAGTARAGRCGRSGAGRQAGGHGQHPVSAQDTRPCPQASGASAGRRTQREVGSGEPESGGCMLPHPSGHTGRYAAGAARPGPPPGGEPGKTLRAHLSQLGREHLRRQQALPDRCASGDDGLRPPSGHPQGDIRAGGGGIRSHRCGCGQRPPAAAGDAGRDRYPDMAGFSKRVWLRAQEGDHRPPALCAGK